MKSALEAEIQRQIEAAIGALPDLLLLKNSGGLARHINDKDGKEFFVPYGLGKGSPDLVGMLLVNAVSCVTGKPVRIARWFCLEVKQPGEEATEEQMKCHSSWRAFGAYIATVHSPGEARTALQAARAEFSS